MPGGMPGAMPGGSNMSQQSGNNNKTSSKKTNKEMENVKLDINAKPIDFLLLFVTGYLVIIIALIIPSVGIMRYQPKTILTGKE
jgi:hypothetical protein